MKQREREREEERERGKHSHVSRKSSQVRESGREPGPKWFGTFSSLQPSCNVIWKPVSISQIVTNRVTQVILGTNIPPMVHESWWGEKVFNTKIPSHILTLPE